MSKDTGGSAFPSYENGKHNDGMTLRDYFAAKAMQSLVSSPDLLLTTARCGKEKNGYGEAESIAMAAYEFAAAMLKAREE